jgi:hypothetical protein
LNESDNNTPGGQLGHPGKTLGFFENPDHVIDIPIDHALLQDGHVYKSCGYMRCFLPLILIDVSSTCAKKAVNK